jgi:hypothetical protein
MVKNRQSEGKRQRNGLTEEVHVYASSLLASCTMAKRPVFNSVTTTKNNENGETERRDINNIL